LLESKGASSVGELDVSELAILMKDADELWTLLAAQNSEEGVMPKASLLACHGQKDVSAALFAGLPRLVTLHEWERFLYLKHCEYRGSMILNWIGDLLDILSQSFTFREAEHDVTMIAVARQGPSRLAQETNGLLQSLREARQTIQAKEVLIVQIRGQNRLGELDLEASRKADREQAQARHEDMVDAEIALRRQLERERDLRGQVEAACDVLVKENRGLQEAVGGNEEADSLLTAAMADIAGLKRDNKKLVGQVRAATASHQEAWQELQGSSTRSISELGALNETLRQEVVLLRERAKHGWKDKLQPAKAQLEAAITELETSRGQLAKLQGDGTTLRLAISKAEALVGWQKGRIRELEGDKMAAAAETGKIFFKMSEKEKEHVALIKELRCEVEIRSRRVGERDRRNEQQVAKIARLESQLEREAVEQNRLKEQADSEMGRMMKQLDVFDKAKGMQGSFAVAERYGPNLEDLKKKIESLPKLATAVRNKRVGLL